VKRSIAIGARASLIVMSLSVFVAACSGGTTSSSVPSTTQGAQTGPAATYSTTYPGIKIAAAMPTPMSPRGVSAAGDNVHRFVDIPGNIEIVPLTISGTALASFPHTLPNLTFPTPTPRPLPSITPPICKPTCNGPDNTVTTQDAGGQAGYALGAGSNGGVGDIYVAMGALNNVSLNNPPAGGYNLLYAPTTHGPNGNCLELSTDYYNGFSTPGSTVAQLQVWDFCANGWAGAVPMDSNFFNTYVRVYSNGNGEPEYVAELAEGTDSAWHAYIYNNNNGDWDDIYDSQPGQTTTVLGSVGWSIFETHYAIGTCSSLPTVTESGLRLHYSNTSHVDWDYASVDVTSHGGDGQCFADQGTTVPYYSYSDSESNDMDWTVTTI